MTLVFASLLILGVLTRSSIVDANVTGAVNAYALLTASIGLAALTYVLAMARRAGLFDARTEPSVAPTPEHRQDGLMLAATVAPSVSTRVRQQQMEAREARRQRANAIIAATTPLTRPSQPTPAGPTPRPASTAPVVPVVRLVSPGSAAPPAPPPAARRAEVPSVQRVMPPSPAPMSVGGAPAYLRMQTPSVPSRGLPEAFQVAAASIREPFWVQPHRPTFADRLFGRGTYRAAFEAGLIPPPMPAAPPRPQPARQH
jgi:hypothetical protein